MTKKLYCEPRCKVKMASPRRVICASIYGKGTQGYPLDDYEGESLDEPVTELKLNIQ